MKRFVTILIIPIGVFIAVFLLLRSFSGDQSGAGPAVSQDQGATTTAPAPAPVRKNIMIITSPSFEDGGHIPSKFTCSGGNINPELQVQNVPPSARSLTLIVDDSDAPSGTFTHWLVWNIDPKTATIKQESVPPGSVEGVNSFGHANYGGPCPPVGASHHYHFTLYAVDATLNLPEGSGSTTIMAQMNKYNIVATAELVGLYP